MKYVIGVVGEIGAGKDTFTTFFRAAVAPLSVSRIKFSDTLTDTLTMWGIPSTRENLQNLAIIMDREYGKGSLTRATKSRIGKTSSDIIVVEGVRWKTDVPMIRSFKNSFLVYVTAKPEIRFKRLRLRGEKVGEKGISYIRFQREGKAGTELDIALIGKNSDVKLENNGQLFEFRLKVEKFASKLK